jgi:integrase/recombinase XerC
VEPSAAWSDAWVGCELDLLSKGRSPSTISNRRIAVMSLARHATAEGLDPGQVTKTWLQRYLVAQARGRRGNGYLSVWEECRQFWLWWADESGNDSPMDGIGRPRQVETEVPILTLKQLDQVMDACKGRTLLDLRNRAILLLLADSGLRRSELCALNVEDVDVKGRTVVVHHGKGDKPRVTTMGETAAQALWRYLRARGGPKDGPLFTAASRTPGTRLTPGGLSQALTAIGNAAGVPGLRAHRFRHSWAHYSKAAGMQESNLMTLGGWTTTEMLRRYGRSLAAERAVEAGRSFSVSASLRKGTPR